ncbi:hypothetical protein MMC12_006664 [Toensbergia leucococca]|nr:hypothetical protein [Toensbergia leucococca]
MLPRNEHDSLVESLDRNGNGNKSSQILLKPIVTDLPLQNVNIIERYNTAIELSRVVEANLIEIGCKAMHERCDVVRELIERRSSTTRYEVVNVSLRAMKNTLAEKIHCIRNMLVVREAQREALEEELYHVKKCMELVDENPETQTDNAGMDQPPAQGDDEQGPNALDQGTEQVLTVQQSVQDLDANNQCVAVEEDKDVKTLGQDANEHAIDTATANASDAAIQVANAKIHAIQDAKIKEHTTPAANANDTNAQSTATLSRPPTPIPSEIPLPPSPSTPISAISRSLSSSPILSTPAKDTVNVGLALERICLS